MLTNTITHGYEDEETHRIEVLLEIEGGVLAVVLVDDARIFRPKAGAAPDLNGSQGEAGGLGLFLVFQVMDEVEHRQVNGCNVVTLRKKLPAGRG